MKSPRAIQQARQKAAKRQFILRLLFAFFVVLISFGLLFSRFYYLQVIEYEEHSDKAYHNRISLIPTAPIRGEIIDANGVVLAHNYPAFSLEIIPDELPQSVEETIELLKPYIEITDGDLRRFKKYRTNYRGYEKIPLKLKLTSEEAGKLASELYRFKGVQINARTFREYPYGKLTSHIIGYIGRISQKDLNHIESENRSVLYRGTTHIGKMGLERFYELQLHGSPGFLEVEKDAHGNVVDVLRTIPSRTGETLQLALDIRMQKKADDLLGDRRGAVVAIDPQTGGVLAMVSKPSYDANLFIDGIDTESWNALNTDWRRPMINRATQGLYPPGSTFKPFMAMGALESGSISQQQMLAAPGAWSIPGTKHLFRDSVRSGHGTINLSKAIQVSSDTFFYQMGYKMGIDTISQYLAPFGFGRQTGIDLPDEYIGVLPSREWKAKRFRKYKANQRQWLPADTVSVSIGQGYNVYTPLQMAFATAVLGNNGVVYRPHLVSQLLNHENRQSTIIEPNPSRHIPYSARNFNYVKHAMQRVLMQGGTGWSIGKDLKYSMAGKTGTAQVIRIKQGASYNAKEIAERHRDHAWFIAFAPVAKPKIAIAVIIENGGWGSYAAPIARELADYYLLELNGKDSEQESSSKLPERLPTQAQQAPKMPAKPQKNPIQAAFDAVQTSEISP